MNLDARPHAADPPPGEGWWKIPAPVRATLARSFVARIADDQAPADRKDPQVTSNLDNAWFGGDQPKTTWEAVQSIGAQGLNIVTRIHERMERVDPSGFAWEMIKYIRNLWWGGSAGFKLVYEDRESMRRHLHRLFDKVAEDLLIGSLEHQRRTSFLGLMKSSANGLTHPASVPPDANTFREIDKLGGEALHFCVSRFEPAPTMLDDIHLDWVSPVKGADPHHRRCIYDWSVGAPHWIQATLHIGKPVFPFDEIGDLIAGTQKRRAKGAKSRSAAAWDDWLGRWLARKWTLAASGKAGHVEAMEWRTQCRALSSDWKGG